MVADSAYQTTIRLLAYFFANSYGGLKFVSKGDFIMHKSVLVDCIYGNLL